MWPCTHTGKHEDTHTNFINSHAHKKYYLQIYSYSWCPCLRDYIVSQSSVPNAFPSPWPPFWITAALFLTMSIGSKMNLQSYCFPSHTGEAISDPHVCLWELKLLFSTCMGFPQPQLNSHHYHQELFSDMRLTTSLRVIKMSWMSLPWHNLTMDFLVLWHLRSFCLLFQDAPKPCVEDVPTEAENPLSGVLHMLASCGFL